MRIKRANEISLFCLSDHIFLGTEAIDINHFSGSKYAQVSGTVSGCLWCRQDFPTISLVKVVKIDPGNQTNGSLLFTWRLFNTFTKIHNTHIQYPMTYDTNYMH